MRPVALEASLAVAGLAKARVWHAPLEQLLLPVVGLSARGLATVAWALARLRGATDLSGPLL